MIWNRVTNNFYVNLAAGNGALAQTYMSATQATNPVALKPACDALGLASAIYTSSQNPFRTSSPINPAQLSEQLGAFHPSALLYAVDLLRQSGGPTLSLFSSPAEVLNRVRLAIDSKEARFGRLRLLFPDLSAIQNPALRFMMETVLGGMRNYMEYFVDLEEGAKVNPEREPAYVLQQLYSTPIEQVSPADRILLIELLYFVLKDEETSLADSSRVAGPLIRFLSGVSEEERSGFFDHLLEDVDHPTSVAELEKLSLLLAIEFKNLTGEDRHQRATQRLTRVALLPYVNPLILFKWLEHGAIPEILRTFTAESSPPKLALLKESIIQLLWEVDRTFILSGLREAMTSADPKDPLATDAVLIASWFGGDMAKAVRKMWPDSGDTTPPALVLRANLLLLLKEIGLPSWTTLGKLKKVDPAFEPNIDRIRSEISQETMRPEHEIRARFDEETVTVYQAFSESLGWAALKNQSLNVDGFKMTRTTWIKPSFRWMLYRSGYGMKEEGQVRILAIRLRREIFEQLLRERESRNVQWDPERRVDLAPLPYRTIQIGVCPEAMKTYLDGIVEITDLTPTARAIWQLVRTGKIHEAEALLPEEKPYPTAPHE